MVRTIVIAGGGTGGHVFPGLAMADEMRRRDPTLEIVFVGTERGLEARVVPDRGYRLELVRVAPLKGMSLARAALSVAILSREMAGAAAFVARTRPALVLCLGGYAGGPVSFVAGAARTPLFLFEPNAVVGFTNRMLARFARRAYVAWPDMEAGFPRGVGAALGVPVRAVFAEARQSGDYVTREYRPAPQLLIMGGSQGARHLNETLPRAVAHARTLGATFRVVHQCGKGNAEDVRARYAALDVEVTVSDFIDDVAGAIELSDVIVARAGAVSLAEICAIGRATILVPLPTAADDHQTKNADILATRGAAHAVPQASATPETLGAQLHVLCTDFALRQTMAAASRVLGKPDAAARIVDDILKMSGL